jgi:hypothetical protein
VGDETDVVVQVIDGHGRIFSALAKFDSGVTGQRKVQAEVLDGAAVHGQVLDLSLTLRRRHLGVFFDATLFAHDALELRHCRRDGRIDVSQVDRRQRRLLIQQPLKEGEAEWQVDHPVGKYEFENFNYFAIMQNQPLQGKLKGEASLYH